LIARLFGSQARDVVLERRGRDQSASPDAYRLKLSATDELEGACAADRQESSCFVDGVQ
jgi:hypothetical protein